jgi:hypothetical protein
VGSAPPDALQDLCLAQPALLVGIISVMKARLGSLQSLALAFLITAKHNSILRGAEGKGPRHPNIFPQNGGLWTT